jgi:tetratricopeptide (TPR) repeat protein
MDCNRALALLVNGRSREALPLLQAAAADGSASTEGWRALADLALYVGDARDADAAWLGFVRSSVRRSDLAPAADALAKGNLHGAEQKLRGVLGADLDPDAAWLMAETAGRAGRWEESEALLSRALKVAPDREGLRLSHVEVLLRLDRWSDSLAEIASLLADSTDSRRARMLKAAASGRLGNHAGAAECSESLLDDYPDQPKAWLMHGHNLRTVGRTDAAVEAYLQAIAVDPGFGEAYWSLANLKTYRFPATVVEAMRTALARDTLGANDRCALGFALAKAEEDAGDYARAFRHYADANAVHRAQISYDPEIVAGIVRRSKHLFTQSYFAECREGRAPSPGPVFILGLPRSGSTLIDQMLASHPAVEALGELSDIAEIANWVAGASTPGSGMAYPDPLRALPPGQLRRLGEAYLQNTGKRRISTRTYFTDKAPGNFLHIGLILSILPNARIIDARRHPLGSCLSAFKQHFGAGWDFAYDLDDLGRYYAEYVDLMRHMDEACTGAVHRVFYEDMVEDPEREIRRLLNYLDLPFDAACLRFYETERAVQTPSSEQVRRPIFMEGVDRWRHFEPWLGPLKTALGPALDRYREAT